LGGKLLSPDCNYGGEAGIEVDIAVDETPRCQGVRENEVCVVLSLYHGLAAMMETDERAYYLKWSGRRREQKRGGSWGSSAARCRSDATEADHVIRAVSGVSLTCAAGAFRL
jgi:hypothetical protein